MKLKSLNCPNCNAKLEIKPGETHGTCPYCDSEFILDEEVIRVKHEIIDNTSLDIAETTLNKFKDYYKAEGIYRTLLYKYAHKEDVYIGLIRSITHDFKKETTNLYTLNEINDYWQRYTSLTTKTNIAKYSPSINDLNRKFWLNKLNTETKNLTLHSLSVNVNEVENAWNKYILFSEETEHKKIEKKFKDYLIKLKEYQAKKKKNFKLTTIIVIVLIITLAIAAAIYSKTETPTKKVKEIKTSSLYKYCDPNFHCKDKSFLTKYFYPTIADLTITSTKFDKEKNTLTVTTNLKSTSRDTTDEYTFKVVDDSGPYIEETNCEFTDTEEIDLTKCFNIIDYTDGSIDTSQATINKNKVNFKKQGTYTIKVTAKDKDNNKETAKVRVKIIPTPITLNVNVSKTSIQINDTATLSYEITPNVSNKEVTITYNDEYIKVKNNVITPVKIGESTLCITSNYDPNTKVCKQIEVTPICQNSYTFKFDGSKEEILTPGVDFCAGTYKVYANVLNSRQVYYIYHYPSTGSPDIISINKKSPFNEEGSKYALGKGAKFKIGSGITSITLTK